MKSAVLAGSLLLLLLHNCSGSGDEEEEELMGPKQCRVCTEEGYTLSNNTVVTIDRWESFLKVRSVAKLLILSRV